MHLARWALGMARNRIRSPALPSPKAKRRIDREGVARHRSMPRATKRCGNHEVEHQDGKQSNHCKTFSDPLSALNLVTFVHGFDASNQALRSVNR